MCGRRIQNICKQCRVSKRKSVIQEAKLKLSLTEGGERREEQAHLETGIFGICNDEGFWSVRQRGIFGNRNQKTDKISGEQWECGKGKEVYTKNWYH